MPDTEIQMNSLQIDHSNRHKFYRHVPEDTSRPAWTQHDFTGKSFMGRRFRTADHSKGVRVGN